MRGAGEQVSCRRRTGRRRTRWREPLHSVPLLPPLPLPTLSALAPDLPALTSLLRSVTVPLAAWANASLAEVSPASLTIAPTDWASPQTLTVSPSPSLVDGTYHISLLFT